MVVPYPPNFKVTPFQKLLYRKRTRYIELSPVFWELLSETEFWIYCFYTCTHRKEGIKGLAQYLGRSGEERSGAHWSFPLIPLSYSNIQDEKCGKEDPRRPWVRWVERLRMECSWQSKAALTPSVSSQQKIPPLLLFLPLTRFISSMDPHYYGLSEKKTLEYFNWITLWLQTLQRLKHVAGPGVVCEGWSTR